MRSISYKSSLVAFIDILGFENLVRQGQVNTILRAMGIIRRRIGQVDGFPKPPSRHAMFSDSVVFSTELTDEGIEALVHNVAYLTAELFHNGILCRGAIAKGDLYHQGMTIFGPALIDAYRLESQLAIYPRILIPYEIGERFLEIKNNKQNRHFQSGMANFFRHDFDNQFHVDVLSPWMSKPPKPGSVSNTVCRVLRTRFMDKIDASTM
jgi:hypothetical protein